MNPCLWPKLINGYRGKSVADKDAVIDAVLAVAAFAESQWDTLAALDINPLLVLPKGQGAIAVDALLGLFENDSASA